MNTASGPHAPSARAWELLRGALDLPPAQRDAFALAACAGDAALLAELRALLARDAGTDALLDAPLDPQRYLGAGADRAAIGSTVGPYRILGELGVGGMGTVYRAERIGGVAKHHVALKVIKRGMDSGEIEVRFLRERDILASLQHPNIARLIDGGVSDAGQAWFAMELIEGEPITAWCDVRRLPLARRIELFLDVCAAVQYAHRNLVVHRDLKPGNVLVSAGGEVKLLDFGIAKLLTAANEGNLQTRSQLRLLTPEFAAPEQFRGEPVTTSTDVYQLGLMLFELLSGRRATPSAGGGASALRLSAALSGPAREGALSREAIAAARSAGVNWLRRQLRGDVSRILAKALNDDPARRYDSAGDFADDLRRYLGGQPVLARPDSVAYRARKFVQRHKAGVAATALVLIALLAASVYSAQQARVAREQLARAEAVRRFLVGVFASADPEENKGRPISAQTLVAKSEQQLGAITIDDPASRADLTGLIGDLYLNVGDYVHAAPLVTQAAALAEDERLPRDIRARNLRILATMERGQYRFDDSIRHARAALAIAPTDARAGERETTEASRLLIDTLVAKGDVAEAQRLLPDVLDDDRRLHGPRSLQVAGDLTLFAKILDKTDQTDAAAARYQEAIGILRALPSGVSSDLAYAYNSLGILLRNKKADYAGAAAALGEAERIYTQMYGADNRTTIAVRFNRLAGTELEGHIEQGLAERLQILELLKPQAEAEPATLAWAWFFLGRDYNAVGRLADAADAFQASLALWAKTQGAKRAIESAYPLEHLAINAELRGNYEEAESLYREAMTIAAANASSDAVHVGGDARGHIGNVLRLRHRYAEALRELDAANASLDVPGNEADLYLIGTQARLAEAQLDAGDAAAAQASAALCVQRARKALPPKSPSLAAPLYALARVDLARGEPEQALALLREALALRTPPLPRTDLRVLEIEVDLARALAASGKADAARQQASAVLPLLAANASGYAEDLRARLRAVR